MSVVDLACRSHGTSRVYTWLKGFGQIIEAFKSIHEKKDERCLYSTHNMTPEEQRQIEVFEGSLRNRFDKLGCSKPIETLVEECLEFFF